MGEHVLRESEGRGQQEEKTEDLPQQDAPGYRAAEPFCWQTGQYREDGKTAVGMKEGGIRVKHCRMQALQDVRQIDRAIIRGVVIAIREERSECQQQQQAVSGCFVQSCYPSAWNNQACCVTYGNGWHCHRMKEVETAGLLLVSSMSEP